MSNFNVPEEYYYTKDHEWAQVDENVVTVCITEYAQDSLGEVVYVELPEEGQKVTQGEPFGVWIKAYPIHKEQERVQWENFGRRKTR